MRHLPVALVTAPPLVLAVVGFSHPHDLDAASAGWWTTLHLLLVPVFPLLGVAHWLLLRGFDGPIAWIGRIAAFGFLTYYGGLDCVSGIATGSVTKLGGVHAGGDSPEVAALFEAGGLLGTIGGLAFLVAGVATAFVHVDRHGRDAAAGALATVAGCALFPVSHIYWPKGVVSLLVLAAGFGLLAWVGMSRTDTAAPPEPPAAPEPAAAPEPE
jgi:hypothetical protein